MKRVLLMCLLAALPMMSFAQKTQRFEVAPFEFEIIGENSVALVGYDYDKEPHPEATELVIPEKVTFENKSYRVTTIEGKGTGSYFSKNKHISSIKIPSSVIEIGRYAFAFTNIESVTIPESVTQINLCAFKHCTKLRYVEILSPKIELSACSFRDCPNLNLVKINSDYLRMDNTAFCTMAKNASKLNEVQVKKAVRPYVTFYDNKYNPKPTITIIDEPQQTTAPTNTYIASTSAMSQPIEDTPKIISDVDQNIPQTSLKNENTFAVIIANEIYTNVSNVDYAAQDGRVFAEYCKQTLGIPEKNIKLIENATLGAIVSNVDWLHNVLKAYGGSAKAIFYYSGHGIPNHETGDSYLLPTDCPPNNYNVAYKLQDLYTKLGEAGGNVTFFIDACFSGMKRQGEVMVAARGVAIKAKPSNPVGSSVVFSAATGDQTAYAYDEKGHGIFTYFLLKKLQDSSGSVSYGELADYIKSEVAKVAIVERSVSQTPTITSTSQNADLWRNWMLK